MKSNQTYKNLSNSIACLERLAPQERDSPLTKHSFCTCWFLDACLNVERDCLKVSS